MEKNFIGLVKSSYLPFYGIKNFWLYSSEDGVAKYVEYKNNGNTYILEIKPQGYKPKTGLILAQSIEVRLVGKSVLDLCTGETGVIGIHAATHGASNVVGADVDQKTIAWAKHNASINDLNNLSFSQSNLFQDISGKFDVITANPPQMPMKGGHIHDSGGEYGREIIEKIISEAPGFLTANGEIYMLLFDFLGIDQSYNDLPSIKQIFENYGFSMEIITTVKRLVRKGGETEKSLKHILEKYPLYSFKQQKGDKYHEVFIIKAKLGR